MSLFAFSSGTDTKAQSCFNSIVPSSSPISLPCLKNKPAISPLEILSFSAAEINSVVRRVVSSGEYFAELFSFQIVDVIG